MKAKKFDSDFEADKDITGSLDLSKARRPLQEQKRVNVDCLFLKKTKRVVISITVILSG